VGSRQSGAPAGIGPRIDPEGDDGVRTPASGSGTVLAGGARTADRAADRTGRVYTVSVTLPHRDPRGAEPGLRAELRRRLAAGGEEADWDTLILHGPRPSSDARGHVWFEYSAAVRCVPDPVVVRQV
jgi:hypothetical protein